MKVCSTSGKGCKNSGKPLPESRFKDENGKVYKTCDDCRIHRRRLRWVREQGGKNLIGYIDPWNKVCEACLLDDCIRGEGDYALMSKREYPGCLIWEGARRGLGPDETLDSTVQKLGIENFISI